LGHSRSTRSPSAVRIHPTRKSAVNFIQSSPLATEKAHTKTTVTITMEPQKV
jgi:hypothetical protein